MSTGYGQNDSVALKIEKVASDTITKDTIKKKKYHGLFLGVDLFNPALSFFTDKKGFQFMAAYQFKRKWVAVAEFGYEKNTFDKIDWLVDANGVFVKAGVNWFFTQDHENPANGVYVGTRLGISKYTQEVKQYPIRGYQDTGTAYGSMSKFDGTAYWLDLVFGGRVEFIKNFYAEFAIHPEIYLGAKKQNDMDPLVIPGYGKDQGSINFNAFWGISYHLPFK